MPISKEAYDNIAVTLKCTYNIRSPHTHTHQLDRDWNQGDLKDINLQSHIDKWRRTLGNCLEKIHTWTEA